MSSACAKKKGKKKKTPSKTETETDEDKEIGEELRRSFEEIMKATKPNGVMSKLFGLPQITDPDALERSNKFDQDVSKLVAEKFKKMGISFAEESPSSFRKMEKMEKIEKTEKKS